MGRRSDHTRDELKALFILEGWRLLAETGLSRFSARDVAKRVGYSIGTLYVVFGSLDGLLLSINARTLKLWSDFLAARLAENPPDRIAALVRGYFDFALQNPRTWMAIYEHHMADRGPAPDWYQEVAANLIAQVAEEIATVLPNASPSQLLTMARSLIATVHGHCAFAVYNTFDMLGENDPAGLALMRVRETLAAAKLASA